MSSLRDLSRIKHMAAHAAEAVAIASGRSRTDLDSDRLLNLALVRLMEIVGEAGSKVSGETQALHPEVPWSQIVGLRNRLIHGYDTVNFDILWDVIQLDLPPLLIQLERIRQSLHS